MAVQGRRRADVRPKLRYFIRPLTETYADVVPSRWKLSRFQAAKSSILCRLIRWIFIAPKVRYGSLIY